MLVYETVENSVFNDLVFFTDTPWLNHKRILQRFPVLGIPIQDFLETKGMTAKYLKIKDKKWQYHTEYE